MVFENDLEETSNSPLGLRCYVIDQTANEFQNARLLAIHDASLGHQFTVDARDGVVAQVPSGTASHRFEHAVRMLGVDLGEEVFSPSIFLFRWDRCSQGRVGVEYLNQVRRVLLQ